MVFVGKTTGVTLHSLNFKTWPTEDIFTTKYLTNTSNWVDQMIDNISITLQLRSWLSSNQAIQPDSIFKKIFTNKKKYAFQFSKTSHGLLFSKQTTTLQLQLSQSLYIHNTPSAHFVSALRIHDVSLRPSHPITPISPLFH